METLSVELFSTDVDKCYDILSPIRLRGKLYTSHGNKDRRMNIYVHWRIEGGGQGALPPPLKLVKVL